MVSASKEPAVSHPVHTRAPPTHRLHQRPALTIEENVRVIECISRLQRIDQIQNCLVLDFFLSRRLIALKFAGGELRSRGRGGDIGRMFVRLDLVNNGCLGSGLTGLLRLDGLGLRGLLGLALRLALSWLLRLLLPARLLLLLGLFPAQRATD